ncbi:hypothetical protein TraAM80_02175 [Trypanosoma rangeli]|uniref:Uncharacterized protein n=1 Tax=Trypanosoma rangeli TaxID=5698 RepID=A0A3R7NPG1_TRYRA|nr:uncharacterized protein TraAM80_02175 [Trypanosoma rangeli]RNF09463.1 hypothetical protein TraAM80_02175 [Trypanosoma rangeli]|eukprot:RNF09463.1 hypothetical protein TraAM80_02175 [Trypanosoma rangeli]
MTVNEAPWLTWRVVVALMVATFLLCLVLDGLKCKKGGMTHCIGGSLAPCEQEVNAPWCDDMVTPPFLHDYKEQCACMMHNDSRLLVHIVEVAPPRTFPSTTQSGQRSSRVLERISIAALVASALKNSTGNVITSNTRNGIFGANLFAPLRTDVGLAPPTTGPCPTNVSSLMVSYSFDTLVVPLSSSLLQDTESVIPFKNDVFALKKHFPRLQRVFEQLLSRRTTLSASKRVACSKVHLAIVITVMPGTKTSWVNKNATNIAVTLFDAHTYVKKMLTRYLRKKPRYVRLLNSIWYVGIPIGFPVHRGVFDYAANVMGLPPQRNNDQGGVKDVNLGSGSVGRNIESTLCSAGDENIEMCRAMCRLYEMQVAAYQEANGGLQKIAEAKGGRVGMRSFFLPYRDHFQTELSAERLNWRDCLQLSLNGSVAVAKSIATSLFIPF